MRCNVVRSGLLALLAAHGASLSAQGVLDVLDGETLYDGGFLLTLGFDLERGDALRSGSDRVPDPSAGHESTMRTTAALQYGLRHDVQVGVSLPFVTHERDTDAMDLDASGAGDIDLLGKWRFYRWDAPGVALNAAVLGQLSLPTGEDDATESGVRLDPELQPGSGGVDPALGLAVTHEPGRWRFNAAALWRWHTDTDNDDTRLGDELVAEVAAGNRFWLEPYPGPFMRADLVTRYYLERDARYLGAALDDGNERATLGINLAFRPRPSLDFQLGVEVPFWQRVDGTQYGDDWAVHLTLGYRF